MWQGQGLSTVHTCRLKATLLPSFQMGAVGRTILSSGGSRKNVVVQILCSHLPQSPLPVSKVEVTLCCECHLLGRVQMHPIPSFYH